MPIDLHQRLSEFSYGYGITRETERDLEQQGLHVTPFLPSLLHEAQLGFDVAFDRPGVPLLLQFKLGQVLQRYRRPTPTSDIPLINRPFWRFEIETAEEDGQFDRLSKAEQSGSDVFYVAPKFTNWNEYAALFERSAVLTRSIMLRPSQITEKLMLAGEEDGWHKVLYDETNIFVCSEPKQASTLNSSDLASSIREKISRRSAPAEYTLKELYESSSLRRTILRRRTRPQGQTALIEGEATQADDKPTLEQASQDRLSRLRNIESRARSGRDALFAAAGIEAWTVGAQLLMVTLGGD